MTDKKDYSAGWQERLPTVGLQADYFRLKFKDLDASKINEVRDQFKKFDPRGEGELQEDEAMRLLEFRGETKRFVELREMVAVMDKDKNRLLSLLELLCAIFKKSWEELHNPGVDEAALVAAIDKLRLAQAEEIEAIQKAKAAEELKAQVIATEKARVEAEAKKKEEEEAKKKESLAKPGAKGKAAMFDYAAADTHDQTADNTAKIKAEAAARKAKKEAEHGAKMSAEEAQRKEAEKKKAEEEARMAEEGSVELEKKRQEEMRAKEAAAKAEAEAAEEVRKAKVKAALAAKFGSK